MLRYELILLQSRRINRLLLLVLLVLAIVFSMFAVWSIHYVDENGVQHAGLSSPGKLIEVKSRWSGKVTPQVAADVMRGYEKNQSVYGADLPDKVYAGTEQAYADIKDMIVSALCYDRDFDEAVLDGIDADRARDIYKIRAENIAREVKEYGTTPAKRAFLERQSAKVRTPFSYAPFDSWDTMGLYATTYAILLIIVISFFAAGIFSDDFRLQADAVFFTTKWGRTRGTRARIAAGLVMATAVYWVFMMILSLLSFAVMGVSGGAVPVQMEYSYCIYALTFMQRYLVIILAGYIGSLLAAMAAMLVSAKTHSALLAICIPFVLSVRRQSGALQEDI
ncbi:MAG: ABC transporter [Anaerovoracaceae bacterium]